MQATTGRGNYNLRCTSRWIISFKVRNNKHSPSRSKSRIMSNEMYQREKMRRNLARSNFHELRILLSQRDIQKRLV